MLASTCCAPPVVLAALGLTTGSVLLAWLDLKPAFLALAVLVLVVGMVMPLIQRKRSCSVTGGNLWWLYPLVTAVSFGIGYWLLMDMATPRLYAGVYASDRSALARSNLVVEPDGRMVSLHRAAIKVDPGCDGCAVSLAADLRRMRGVHAAAVDVERHQAIVLYDPGRTNTRTIRAAIPYRWFFKPRLSSDVALQVSARLPALLGGVSWTSGLLAVVAMALVWIAIRTNARFTSTRRKNRDLE